MTLRSGTDAATLLLRVTLGVMYLAHGLLLKVLIFGVAGTVGFFASVGLPAPVAYATIAGEILGGALLVLGVRSQWVALALTPTLLGAIIWVHGANGWVFSAKGGGWEYPAFLLVVSAAVALLGDGPYALAPARGRNA
jgi:putative oxidoreductase